MNYKKIYVIYDTQEDCFVTFNHKAAWTKVGNAKNSFNVHMFDWSKRSHKRFDEQTRYIILPVTVDEVR